MFSGNDITAQILMEGSSNP